MLKPRFGVGGKVGVVSKDLFGMLKYRQLNQIAGLANINLERIIGFHLKQLLFFEVGIREGG
jgi:hypothetical protein